jgi:hypothetical protein
LVISPNGTNSNKSISKGGGQMSSQTFHRSAQQYTGIWCCLAVSHRQLTCAHFVDHFVGQDAIGSHQQDINTRYPFQQFRIWNPLSIQILSHTFALIPGCRLSTNNDLTKRFGKGYPDFGQGSRTTKRCNRQWSVGSFRLKRVECVDPRIDTALKLCSKR